MNWSPAKSPPDATASASLLPGYTARKLSACSPKSFFAWAAQDSAVGFVAGRLSLAFQPASRGMWACFPAAYRLARCRAGTSHQRRGRIWDSAGIASRRGPGGRGFHKVVRLDGAQVG